MEEYVQEFKRAVRGSRYEGRLLVEEFKREINSAIRRKLIEAKNQSSSIEQQYRRAIALNWNQRKSRREKEKLRKKKEQGEGALKQKQRQMMPRLLVQQRRQQLPQQVTTGPAPIEEVERTNVVVVKNQGQSAKPSLKRDPYAIEVDRKRNCYTYREFGHIAHHYRNQRRVMQGRRVEYGGGRIEEVHDYRDNLKEVENLELLNQILKINIVYQLEK